MPELDNEMKQAFRSAAEVLALLDKRRTESPDPVGEERKRLYRQAAAVLVSIKEPGTLQPVGGGGLPEEGRRALAAELIPATGRKFEGQVMLRPEARRAAISELSTVQARQRALEANLQERTGTLQDQLERYLLESALPLEEQPPKQLDETLQIVTWLEGALDNLPPMRDVAARITFRSFSAPFESLAGDAIFRGRRAELDQLRSYVGVLEPVALLSRLADKAFRWTRPDARPALSISGAGGVGKSALVARFMLEHSRVSADARIPFVYLDFDRPVLNIGEPGTLLAEMLSQLDMQFEREAYFRELREFFVKEMGTGERQDTEPEAYDASVTSVIADMVGLIEHRLGPRPFVIVLDTFEEVQYRGENIAFPFWELLDRMQRPRPFLRVVVSGRAPVTSLILADKPPEHIELGELDHEAAVGYVQAQGIQDLALARALVKQMGGMPLSLKLAASVVKRDGAKGVKDISGKSTFWFSTSDEVIQGLLYSRILGHLHDPVLERLAQPGLVLRRISPDVILNVLNEPCQLGISSIEEAQVLFDKLRRETSLVASDTLDGTLVHRPDLRRATLKLLVEKMPAVADQIHRAAVSWYASQVGWRAKTEELYHRLQLGELPPDSWLDHPDVHSSLRVSISELPLAAQRYLATRGYQIAREVLEQASREDQEAALAAEVEELLPHGPRSVEHAWTLLDRVFSKDHAGPLFCSAARIRAQQERFKDAAKLVRLGLDQTSLARHSRESLSLLCERAWLLRRQSDPGDLRATLPILEEYAHRHDVLPAILQHRIQAYELSRRKKAPDSASPDILLREIAGLLSRLTSYELWSVFPLLEEVVKPLADEATVLLVKLLHDEEGPFRRVQFPSPYRNTQRALDRVIIGEAETMFPSAVQDLCKAWPFRVLGVKPPYSSGSFSSEAAR